MFRVTEYMIYTLIKTYNTLSVDAIDYDLNGNIKNVRRESNSSLIDDLNYEYSANKLKAVDDVITSTTGNDFNDNGNYYNQGIDEYFYDKNGNMILDKNKGVNISYNKMDKPITANFGNGNYIRWTYNGFGTKIKEKVYENSRLAIEKNYVNGFEYTKNYDTNGNYSETSMFRTAFGKCVKEGNRWNYEYDIKDHLGNVRMIVKDNNGTAQVLQETHYYPFGMQIPDLCYSSSDSKYLYNGKEFEDAFNLDWYYYGARFYDVQLGRWHSYDPADEFFTPYSYVGSNPINFLDPNGMYIYYYGGPRDESTGYWVYDEEGNEIFIYNDWEVSVTYSNRGVTQGQEQFNRRYGMEHSDPCTTDPNSGKQDGVGGSYGDGDSLGNPREETNNDDINNNDEKTKDLALANAEVKSISKVIIRKIGPLLHDIFTIIGDINKSIDRGIGVKIDLGKATDFANENGEVFGGENLAPAKIILTPKPSNYISPMCPNSDARGNLNKQIKKN